MTGLYYEDLHVGMQFETAGRTITEADVVIYSGLSGDYNALHTDAEYARTTPFGERIAHGPLVFVIAMGLLNRLGVTDGTSLGLLAVENLLFKGPVKFGDTVRGRVAVSGMRLTSKPERGVITRSVTIVNQRDEPVLEASVVTLLATRPSGLAWS
jgi:acyl dehydratase